MHSVCSRDGMARTGTDQKQGCLIAFGNTPWPAPAIGKLQRVVGPVRLARADLTIAARVGDLLYHGDVVETGADGLAAILFVDGTTFHLDHSGSAALDDAAGTDAKSLTAVRIAKGRFGLIAAEAAADASVLIDTPLGALRTRRSAVGFGTVAIGVFTFAFIDASRADALGEKVPPLIDDGTIDYKDLKYGVFEI